MSQHDGQVTGSIEEDQKRTFGDGHRGGGEEMIGIAEVSTNPLLKTL
jgi:hypothetical protein